jgi:hypothetical protein
MAKLPAKRKKAPKVYSRRARTGFAAAPTESFHNFYDYVRLEVDKKDISARVKSYIKKSYPKREQEILLAAPDFIYASSFGFASSLYWEEIGKEFPPKWSRARVEELAINNIRYWGNKKLIEKSEDSDTPKKVQTRSPMEIVKERTSDFIGEIEETIDMFGSKTDVDWDEYSVYNELKKIDAPYNMAKGVYDYYVPLRDEIQELIEKKTEDLVEAYSWMKIPQRKQYLKIIQAILDDADSYMASKKAVRKVRKPRVRSAEKQVEKVQYLKESAEFKVTSIPPSQIVGARRVYLFNTKQRLLTELVCRLSGGFEVSGTTIQGIDMDVSRTIRLRKPADFLPIVLSKTPNQIDKEWKALTTKEQASNGRINKDTIIMRALDK